jgi:hypothetical protein
VLIVLDWKALVTFALGADHLENTGYIPFPIVQIREQKNLTVARMAGDGEIPFTMLRILRKEDHGGSLQTTEYGRGSGDGRHLENPPDPHSGRSMTQVYYCVCTLP